MKIDRQVLRELKGPYAVNLQRIGGRVKAVFAAEVDSQCVGVWADTLEQEIIWEHQGGTMNTCQLNENGDFLAIQRFYRGFQCKTACIVRAEKQGMGWRQTEIAALPFCHRMCVVEIGGVQHMVCSVLCEDKNGIDDWSQPGRVVVSKIPKSGQETVSFTTILNGIHKNHGLFQGTLDGRDVILITGQEGLFRLSVPKREEDPWSCEKLIDREISDCAVMDIDGDGCDEMITIEKFHGSRVVIYKRDRGEWRQVYDYPVKFGHAIWSGTIFSQPAFIIGYRASNAALLLFRLKEKREDDWLMEVTTLDEHEAPTNVAVLHCNGKEMVFSCSGGKDRIMLYELTDEG